MADEERPVRFDVTGRVTLITCGTCGAVVTAETVQQHSEWHVRLNRRMDAASFFGDRGEL